MVVHEKVFFSGDTETLRLHLLRNRMKPKRNILDIIEEIENVGDIDQRGFWFLINKSHGKSRINVNSVISNNDELLNNIQKILPVFNYV